MRHKWTIELQGELCIITRDDGLIRQEAPRSKLKEQMVPHGVVDDIYEDLCDQLEGRGRATVLATEIGQSPKLSGR